MVDRRSRSCARSCSRRWSFRDRACRSESSARTRRAEGLGVADWGSVSRGMGSRCLPAYALFIARGKVAHTMSAHLRCMRSLATEVMHIRRRFSLQISRKATCEPVCNVDGVRSRNLRHFVAVSWHVLRRCHTHIDMGARFRPTRIGDSSACTHPTAPHTSMEGFIVPRHCPRHPRPLPSSHASPPPAAVKTSQPLAARHPRPSRSATTGSYASQCSSCLRLPTFGPLRMDVRPGGAPRRTEFQSDASSKRSVRTSAARCSLYSRPTRWKSRSSSSSSIV